MTGEGLKLEELARRAGLSPRTVRYYVQRGLVPPPTFRGKDSSYGATHVLRLKVIRALQGAFLPLESIKVVLASNDDRALQHLLKNPSAALPSYAQASSTTAPVASSREHAREEPRRDGIDAERWRKFALADGVELLVREGVAEDARVRRILKTFEEEK